mmetsp:Transcript_15499/g.20514  ORF Transcript_15499/g.20514 Transcript_15499/m.20514 type:complete len:441 (+) Transcript_15499:48-1370(+)
MAIGFDMVSAVKPNRENGETWGQMRHATKIKARNDNNSKDQEWKTRKSLCLYDYYVMIVAVPYLLMKSFFMVVPCFLLSLPLCLWCKINGLCLKTPTERFTRRCFLALLALPLSLPLFVLAFLSLILDFLIYYLFGLPIFIIRSIFCQTKICQSYRALRPYRSGPWIAWYANDFYIALLGQILRHGACESALKLAWTFTYVPMLKYWINCNPLIYNLEERFVQQISTPMADMHINDIVQAGKNLINRTKNTHSTRIRLDMGRFVPHYPYPPPSRNWALGLQAGGNKLYTSFLLVHTTHFQHEDSIQLRDENALILSNSVEVPYVRVMLWYNNPYHFVTGYVEAHVSNGRPSQPDKNPAFEHPMWVVTSRSPMLSDRNSWTGIGSIDHFFDSWLPWFVQETRRLVRGDAAAIEMYQEVESKNGISRVKEGKKKHVVPGHVI